MSWIPHAGVHRLAIVARKIDRPTLDQIVLTRSATPGFVDDGKSHGARPPPGRPARGRFDEASIICHPRGKKASPRKDRIAETGGESPWVRPCVVPRILVL